MAHGQVRTVDGSLRQGQGHAPAPDLAVGHDCRGPHQVGRRQQRRVRWGTLQREARHCGHQRHEGRLQAERLRPKVWQQPMEGMQRVVQRGVRVVPDTNKSPLHDAIL